MDGDTQAPDAPATPPPATTTPAQAQPVLTAIKAALAAKDATIADLTASTAKALADTTTAKDAIIADLTAKLADATSNGAALAGKISAQAATIDTLHEALAEYELIEMFFGLPVS